LLNACATQSLVVENSVRPYFETAPAGLSQADAKLFTQALHLQKNNQLRSSFKTWKEFLRKHPRSHEARNNLGLVLYADDQLDLAIKELEAARSLEPGDLRIKKNLVRALKFRATLLKENQDFHSAITHYKRVMELSDAADREKAQFQIEKLQDRVFRQVKRVNTLNAYEQFVSLYPDSPGNSNEARRRIKILKKREPQAVPLEVGVEGAMDPVQVERGTIGTESDTLPLLQGSSFLPSR
jgi:tetratricopeptide (TPR) repeat protein